MRGSGFKEDGENEKKAGGKVLREERVAIGEMKSKKK